MVPMYLRGLDARLHFIIARCTCHFSLSSIPPSLPFVHEAIETLFLVIGASGPFSAEYTVNCHLSLSNIGCLAIQSFMQHHAGVPVACS